MSLRYMTGETREEEDRYHCPRCDTYRGYVCAEHRKPSYAELHVEIDRLYNALQKLYDYHEAPAVNTVEYEDIIIEVVDILKAAPPQKR
jgi:hypothetical protein